LASYHENVGQLTGVEFVEGDASRSTDVAEALHGVRAVVYLVHSSVPETSMRDMGHDLVTNVVPMIRMLDVLRATPQVKRLVYVSSGGTVYGDPTEKCPIPETHATNPVSSYGLTKLMCEHYIRLCLAGSHVRPVILRPGNVYGERQNLSRNQGIVG